MWILDYGILALAVDTGSRHSEGSAIVFHTRRAFLRADHFHYCAPRQSKRQLTKALRTLAINEFTDLERFLLLRHCGELLADHGLADNRPNG